MITPHVTGSGPFILTTRSWITCDAGVVEFRCEHRFQTAAGRAAFRAIADTYGIVLSEEMR